MSKERRKAISPTREENYPLWYQEIVREGDLAENSSVRGCMVIKPWGYGIWENMQHVLDRFIKKTGHKNAYFPLFIPLSFLQKEAEHVEGFAKECAVVTHHRLEKDKNGKLVPAGELEEPLIVRPTSEMIIGDAFSRWINSYRDLPVLINQWANVVRWEMRTRMFLRTTEFLWQEGHTAHATKEEAEEETSKMLNVYADFAKDYLAIPVIKGIKPESERFPGAEETFSVEAMMQDRKALQFATSHFLGQKFAKAAGIKFNSQGGEELYAWTTSWGASTRMMGALIMVHSDDDGLVLPPKIAPLHLVILPVIHKEDTRSLVMDYCDKLADDLGEIQYGDSNIRIFVDKRDMRGGDKRWEHIKKGVPLIVEIGPRDIENAKFMVSRRNSLDADKLLIDKDEFSNKIVDILEEIQSDLYDKALKLLQKNLIEIETEEEFYSFFTPKNKENPEIHGGFAICNFSFDPDVEERLKNDLGITIRGIPLEMEHKEGVCPFTKRRCSKKVIFAKSY